MTVFIPFFLLTFNAMQWRASVIKRTWCRIMLCSPRGVFRYFILIRFAITLQQFYRIHFHAEQNEIDADFFHCEDNNG